jgi:cytoskeleton protein RodZ
MKKVRSMSEQDFLPPNRTESGAGPNSVAPGSEATAGALLRQARQAQGLHLAALAAALKVPVHKLEALEQDRFDLLLDAVFVRALASGMCRLLKLDPEPILARLPSASTMKVPPQNWGINEPFRGRSTGLGSFFPAQLSKPVILVGLALLLGAVALIFLPAMQQEKGGKQADPGASAGTPSSVQEAPGNSQPAVSANPPEMVALPASAAAAASAPVPAALPASASVFPTTTGSASDASAASIATFSATKSSWVKVTDAKGVAILGRTLQPGESANVSGALPFSVVIGRADAIQVQVRGQAFDLNAVAKNNVARFEVK